MDRSSFVLGILIFNLVAVTMASAQQKPSLPRQSWQTDQPTAIDQAISAPTTSPASTTGVFDTKTNWLSENDCAPACDIGCSDCSGWYGQIEAIFWARVNRNSDQPVVILTQDANGNYPGPTVLSTGDLSTADANTGIRAMLGYRRDACSAIEATYFGIWDWDASATVTGDDDLAIPGDLGLASLDFFAADRMVVTYGSELHNAEFNYVRDICGCCGWQWLVGFRYLSLDEVFNIQSTDVDTGTSNYNIRTSNDLYGGQIGARVVRRYRRWGWDATGKVGVFGNDAEQSQFVSDFPPGFFLRPLRSTNGGQVSCVADINISAVYRLTKSSY